MSNDLCHCKLKYSSPVTYNVPCIASLLDPGWYDSSTPESEIPSNAAKFRALGLNKPYMISETGGGAIFEWSETANGTSDAKWTQRFQDELVMGDVTAALENDAIDGITTWILADFKVDEVDDVCWDARCFMSGGPCDASYVNVSSSRPCGMNHKGIVDFWRRPKALYPHIQEAYENQTAWGLVPKDLSEV